MRILTCLGTNEFAPLGVDADGRVDIHPPPLALARARKALESLNADWMQGGDVGDYLVDRLACLAWFVYITAGPIEALGIVKKCIDADSFWKLDVIPKDSAIRLQNELAHVFRANLVLPDSIDNSAPPKRMREALEHSLSLYPCNPDMLFLFIASESRSVRCRRSIPLVSRQAG